SRDDPMTLRELLETLKAFGIKLALHDADIITAHPPEILTPAVRAALAEHHAALVVLIRSGPSMTSSFDTLLSGLDDLGARPAAARCACLPPRTTPRSLLSCAPAPRGRPRPTPWRGGLLPLAPAPPAEVLQERLRILADGLARADPLVRELVRAEVIARLIALG